MRIVGLSPALFSTRTSPKTLNSKLAGTAPVIKANRDVSLPREVACTQFLQTLEEEPVMRRYFQRWLEQSQRLQEAFLLSNNRIGWMELLL
jgi:hypothetical protein